jgi:hypothetical protein
MKAATESLRQPPAAINGGGNINGVAAAMR